MTTDADTDKKSSACPCRLEDFLNPGTVIATGSYRTPPSQYVALAMSRVAGRWWWIVVVPVAAALIMSAFDLRWALVALIFIFLVTPFLLVNAYFSRLLTAEARRAILPKKLTVNSLDSIVITYVAENEDTTPLPPEAIEWSCVTAVKRHRQGWLICLRNSPITGIIVSDEAIISVTPQQNCDTQPK